MRDKVLFVDDEVMIIELVEMIFRNEEFDVKAVLNPAEALEEIKKEKYQIVVSDLNMPDMDGFELLEDMARISPDTIGIVLTGIKDVDQVMSAANRDSVWRYISKPFKKNDIREIIIRGLSAYHAKKDDEERVKKIESMNSLLKDQLIQRNMLLSDINYVMQLALQNESKNVIMRCILSMLLKNLDVDIFVLYDSHQNIRIEHNYPIELALNQFNETISHVEAVLDLVKLEHQGISLGSYFISPLPESEEKKMILDEILNVVSIIFFQETLVDSTPELIDELDALIGDYNLNE